MANNFNPPFNGKIPIIAQSCIPHVADVAFPYQYNVVSDPNDEWVGVPELIRQIHERVKQCGINTIIYTSGTDKRLENLLALTAEEKYNLPVIFINRDCVDTPYAAIDGFMKFCNNPRVTGWNIMDEPKFYDWGDVLCENAEVNNKKVIPTFKQWNALTIGYMICRQLAPDKLCYWNCAVYHNDLKEKIYSNIKPIWTGTCKTYEQYLDTLQQLYKPKLWSYDVYPFIWKNNIIENDKIGDKNDIDWKKEINEINKTIASTVINLMTKTITMTMTFHICYIHFYNSLRLFSNQAKNNNAAFWAYGLVASLANYIQTPTETCANYWEWKYDAPSIGELRFEVFSALAFGAQGIVYFRFSPGRRIDDPYWINKGSGEYFLDAPLMVKTQYNEKESFDNQYRNIRFQLAPNETLLNIIKTVNSEIEKYNDVFYGSEIEQAYQIYQYGQTPYDDGITRSHGLPGEIEITPEYNGDESKGVLLTTLVKKDVNGNVTERYVVIVSHDPFKPQEVNIRFNGPDGTHGFTIKSEYYYSKYPIQIPDRTQEEEADKEYDWPGNDPAFIPDHITKYPQDGYYALKPGGYLILKQLECD